MKTEDEIKNKIIELYEGGNGYLNSKKLNQIEILKWVLEDD